MKLTLYQVDAFTDKLFSGNPAAVIPVKKWIPAELMQQLAMENNLSETVFFVPSKDKKADYAIRWFTPALEINLCGHAISFSPFGASCACDPPAHLGRSPLVGSERRLLRRPVPLTTWRQLGRLPLLPPGGVDAPAGSGLDSIPTKSVGFPRRGGPSPRASPRGTSDPPERIEP